MPAEKKNVLGACRITLTGKLWKQGASLKCERGEVSYVSYPRPKFDSLHGLVREICEDCEHNPYNEKTRVTPEQREAEP